MPGRRLTTVLRPGDIVPRSGVYAVRHARHRSPHDVSLVDGDTFPACRTCGQQVRYVLVDPARGDGRLPRSRASLLLVDTEKTISYTLKQILESCGYRVDTAASYRNATDLLRRRGFDVVLTEVDLDRGAEGLRLALEARRLNPPPVVVLSTSQPTPDGLRNALGLAHYLVFKPIDLTELQNALQTMVTRRALELAPFYA